ncbi:YihY/virulence factor BrkB family protein [Streptacidiphilus anmyonensis]|uniref:YihY/virulence factor BrkB family protein n=1 Tax=Streptacidiphilus anmyonensis TaxID=405782 RepID=UPI0005AA3DEF|nr:YhjD/YihY/BrkB family envelope integrity protein [Streptacidiphilus anmyonensis]
MRRSPRASASDGPENEPAAPHPDAAAGSSPIGGHDDERHDGHDGGHGDERHDERGDGHDDGHDTGHSGVRHARQAADWGKEKYTGSWAQSLWRRLDAADFINRAMLLAATLLLCIVPFFLIVTALAGGSAAADLSRRFGLSREAADDVGRLVASSSTTSSAVTGMSWVFFVLGGLAGATAIQQLYQRVFDLPPRRGRDVVRALVWIGLVVGLLFAASGAGPGLRRTAPVLAWPAGFVAVTCVFWFSMWFLLAGRIPWRRLLPCAVATGACWTGMTAVFSAVLSGMIVSYDRKYGPIGAVFAFMSLFIAIGVVLILGAALGLVWTDHGLSFRNALGKMRRSP